MADYEKLMKKCIQLAKKGEGNTAPNPMVGCIILNKNNEIISTGYHHKYGKNHAERDALLKLKNGEEKDGTLIVNLEPCSHYGKTPPCADLIIERKLKKVVIGCKDNNPKVNGGGIKKLKDANIEIVTGVLEKECKELNKIFFTNIEEKRTFVALKTATTIDGKIATHNGDSKWITSNKSRLYGKKLRKKYSAILTSAETVIKDNPQMLHKTKIILDKSLRTNFNSEIYKNGHIIIAINENKNIENISIPSNVEFLKCKVSNNNIDLKDLLSKLFEKRITSIFVESGGTLSGSFIKENLVDTLYQFIAPKITNDNNSKSCFNGDNINFITECKEYNVKNIKKLEHDIFIEYTK